MRERNPHHKVNTTTLYDEMVDLDEEGLEVEQVLECLPSLYAVYRAADGSLKATKVNYLLVSEGTLWGFSGARDEVDLSTTAETLPGFVGYVIKEGASELSSKELEQSLELTTNEED